MLWEAAVPVLSGTEPFSHDGSGDIGVLLCHGSTSAPQGVVPGDGFHVATSDHDAPQVSGGSVEFRQRIHRDRVEELV